MGFPPASKCMACHVLIAKDKPAIQKLARFAASKEPVPWERVYRLALVRSRSPRPNPASGLAETLDLKALDEQSRRLDLADFARFRKEFLNGRAAADARGAAELNTSEKDEPVLLMQLLP